MSGWGRDSSQQWRARNNVFRIDENRLRFPKVRLILRAPLVIAIPRAKKGRAQGACFPKEKENWYDDD